jgi:biotin carboxyl carrier protein
MKLLAETAEAKHAIEIKRVDGRVSASIDGREYEIEVSEPEAGVYLIKHSGKIYEITVTPDSAMAASCMVRVGSSDIAVRITDPKRLRGTADADGVADGLAEIRTAMPGKVVRVLVEPGTEVEKGDGVIVVEAMKMQNELKAPKTGVIKDIRVSAGSTVSAGETLATIE